MHIRFTSTARQAIAPDKAADLMKLIRDPQHLLFVPHDRDKKMMGLNPALYNARKQCAVKMEQLPGGDISTEFNNGDWEDFLQALAQGVGNTSRNTVLQTPDFHDGKIMFHSLISSSIGRPVLFPHEVRLLANDFRILRSNVVLIAQFMSAVPMSKKMGSKPIHHIWTMMERGVLESAKNGGMVIIKP